MKVRFLCCMAVLLPVLGGCGVPDLVAHGVKSYERTQDKAQNYDSSQQQPAPAAYGANQSYTPAPVARGQDADPTQTTVEAVPQREDVVAEPLK